MGRGATTAGQIWDSHLIQGLARQQQKIGLLSRYRRNEEEIESVKESGLIGVEDVLINARPLQWYHGEVWIQNARGLLRGTVDSRQ